jgi:hypothetical protein
MTIIDSAVSPRVAVSLEKARTPHLPTFIKPPRKPGFFDRPGWPLTLGLMGFPVFWACGLGEFVWPIVAVPMAVQLWPRRRTLRVPPYFGMWLALLAWVVLGVVMLGQVLPGSLADSGGLFGWITRVIDLFGATIVLLYLGNLSERDFPTRKVIRMLGFLFIVTVIGGLLGTFFGNVSWTSPFEYLLPNSFSHNSYVRSLVHPGFAQVEDVLGFSSPRPKAPFAYTNTWGNNISILLIWFVVGWWVRGSHRERIFGGVVLAAALIPIIYSLNRGVWIGLGIALVYVIAVLVQRGRLGLLITMLGVLSTAALVFTVTPLNRVVSERLAHPHSNNIRSHLNESAFDAALKSPIIGWGSTRSYMGSPSSIAIGKTTSCPNCGNAPIGSTGEIWYSLIANGFVGTGLYYGFIVLSAFFYRRDKRPEAAAARLILYLAPFFGLFYPALPTALTITFISLALLWRSNAPRLPSYVKARLERQAAKERLAATGIAPGTPRAAVPIPRGSS